LNGTDLRKKPFYRRQDILINQGFEPTESYTDYEELLELTQQGRIEGFIAKKWDSTYDNQRNLNWIKYKKWIEEEFDIVGLTKKEPDKIGNLRNLIISKDGKKHHTSNFGLKEGEHIYRDLLKYRVKEKGAEIELKDVPYNAVVRYNAYNYAYRHPHFIKLKEKKKWEK
jgi:ATP-dependent DNA ligase